MWLVWTQHTDLYGEPGFVAEAGKTEFANPIEFYDYAIYARAHGYRERDGRHYRSDDMRWLAAIAEFDDETDATGFVDLIDAIVKAARPQLAELAARGDAGKLAAELATLAADESPAALVKLAAEYRARHSRHLAELAARRAARK